MAYRNKTFVSFASEDIRYYRLMQAWRDNERIEFDFHDAHDLNTALDTSQPDTIRRRLGERLANTKQVVMLIGEVTRRKAADPASFIHYEAEAVARRDLPVVLVNLNGNRTIPEGYIPDAIWPLCTVSVSFNARIIQHALDQFPNEHASSGSARRGLRERLRVYPPDVYRALGL
jgi:hypothetical protein